MTNKETQKILNQYVKEINAVLMGKPDEVTGYCRDNPLLDEFFANRSQMTVFSSFINLGSCVSVDKHEPLSKTLVIERAIDTLICMANELGKTEDKLKMMLVKAGKTPARVQLA